MPGAGFSACTCALLNQTSKHRLTLGAADLECGVKIFKTFAVVGMAATVVVGTIDVASARPVRHGGGRHYAGARHRGGGNVGAGVAAGAALGLLGAGIAGAAAADNGYGYGYPAYGYGNPGYGYYGPGYGYYGY